MWPTFLRQHKALGLEVLRWEKEEALRLVRQSLRDIDLARPTLAQDDYDNLMRMFEQGRDVILAYRSVLSLCHGRLHPQDLPAAVNEAAELAERLESNRGEAFFGHLPTRLRQLAQFVLDITKGVPPDGAARKIESEQEAETDSDDEAIDFQDIGLPLA